MREFLGRNAGSLIMTAPPIHVETLQSSSQSPRFNVLECYNAVFSSSVATSAEMLDQCFRVRFQAYCIDNGFEDPASYPDGLERDDFDSHSVQSILTHNATGDPIGAVRLILPGQDGRRRVLPIQRIVGAIASEGAAPFPILRTAEISRFSIVKRFRHYIPEQGFEARLSSEEWRRMLFHLPLGLIKSCVEMSVREEMSHWAAVMEPALLRLLTRLGIHFNPLGSLVEHHGRRQPCWADVGIMLERVHAERPDVWNVITDSGRLWPRTRGNTVETMSRLREMSIKTSRQDGMEDFRPVP